MISSLGLGNYAPGYFSLYFDNDNVLRLIYYTPAIASVYWPDPDYKAWEHNRTLYNDTRLAVLDDTGSFLSSDDLQFDASDMGPGIKRRLTLDYDGNLRFYSLDNETRSWMVSWQALAKPCEVHGICGQNGICVYTPKHKCSCPSAYEMNDPRNWSKDCKPKFKITCSKSENVQFIKIPHVDFWGYDINYTWSISLDTCQKICMDNCQCKALGYMQG